MELVIKITQFVLSFSLLVIIHELGHFLFARMFGIRVEKFYLFFNPWFSLCKFKIGKTEYGIGWIPFGGYVKIAGMIDESMDTEQMAQPPQPDEFRSKPAWQRLLVMVGGVLMNVVLALCIYIGMSFTWGDRYIANEDVPYGYVFNDLGHRIGFQDGDRVLSVEGKEIENSAMVFLTMVLDQATEVEVLRNGEYVTVTIPEQYRAEMLNSADFMEIRSPFVVGDLLEDSPAAQAGLQKGDSLTAFNGEPMGFFDQYQQALATHSGQRVTVTVARDSAGVQILRTLPMEVSSEGKIGVMVASPFRYIPIRTQSYTFWQAIPNGLHRTGTEIANYWKQIKMLFSPSTEAYKSLGGVLAIGSIYPTSWNWEAFWSITAMLSLVLAVMNILPIPALDGGHVLFLLYEVISRRKPSDKFMEHAQMVGILILLALLIFANGNDIYRFFIK